MLLHQLLSAQLQIRGVRGLDQLLSDENYRNYLLACKSKRKAAGTLNAYSRVLSELGMFLKQYHGEILSPAAITPIYLGLWFVAL